MMQKPIAVRALKNCFDFFRATFRTRSVSAELTPLYRERVRDHLAALHTVPTDGCVFFGDSIMQGLDVLSVTQAGVNYGIGSDTTGGVLRRIPAYCSVLERCDCVVVAVGVNDCHKRGVRNALESYSRILGIIPPDVRVVVSAVLPVDGSISRDLRQLSRKVREFNAGLMSVVSGSQREDVEYVNHDPSFCVAGESGFLRSELHVGDGVHLNLLGYDMWALNLAAAVRTQRERHRSG